MAEYRTLRMSFWNDPYVEELGPEGRLLYLYLITCPHTNSLGVLEVSTRRMAYETGLSPESVDALIAEAERAGKLVKDGTLLWLVNFVKHQASTSPRLVQSLRGLWKRLSSARIRRAVRDRYPELFGPGAADVGPGEGVDTVSDRMDALCGGSIKEEEEQEKRPPGEGGCRPPTEAEVRAYCESRNNGISARGFVEFYASRGWKAGGSPMRDWRAAVRAWEAKRGMRSASRTQGREMRNEEAARRALERFEGAATFREGRS